MVSRGFVVTPTGVSDSHSHRGGVGENRTYVAVDTSRTLVEGLTEGIRGAKVSLKRGPLITVTTQNQWATGMPSAILQPANLEIDVLYPSWMQIDSIEVWKDTEMVEELPWEGTSILYSAQSEEDAVFHFKLKEIIRCHQFILIVLGLCLVQFISMRKVMDGNPPKILYNPK